MRRLYIHDLSDWPGFKWDKERLTDLLADVRHKQGRLTGHMEALGFDLRQKAVLHTLTAAALKSSGIEGEVFDKAQVRSFIARHLGMDIGALKPGDRHVEEIVEMVLDATQHYDQQFNEERLFSWHAALFPIGRSGMRTIKVEAWRDEKTGPMQVVSGSFGKVRVHYEAPAPARLSQEISAFLEWFNRPPYMDEVLKSEIAHLWFVTIHPLDDGNGRIARAIADMLLASSGKSPQRFYRMLEQIRQERTAYYDISRKRRWAPWMPLHG